MESQTASGFPRYRDGDVLIYVGPRQRYELHANVLRRNSSYFEKLLASNNAAQLSSRAKKEGITTLYLLEWIKPDSGSLSGIGSFNLRSLDPHGRPLTGLTINFLENDNGKAPNHEYRFWDFLFGIFYNQPPRVRDEDIVDTLSDCMGIIDVAESVQAVGAVREHVDLALLRYGAVLFNSIATNPVAWVDLGYRVRSPTIFKEAIVHMVGKWNMMTPGDKQDLRQDVRDLCEQKYNELDVAKEAIEMRILGHYPESMTRTAADKPGRPAYCNDIYMWMSLSFFRQWFAQAINDNRTRRALDGGYAFYQSVHLAGRTYLTHEDFRNFHQYFPMSSKACNILEANMGLLKEDVKVFVGDLMTNRTSVDPNSYELGWLTCTVVNKEDFPWEAESADNAVDPQVGVSGQPLSNGRSNL
ncbi:hypothetical protein UCRPC4_g04591 [Phaeomoniella chlamydospora]|uniref:BTB domain-containing protein n=1 Tax=Phaeomoniella chlamydospora TaxID=158046 RepID=A0A0G2E884_PHACM|nr:hypothetical protein UCRPC4_g04591 [Phaeomoniella chlamydospora]